MRIVLLSIFYLLIHQISRLILHVRLFLALSLRNSFFSVRENASILLWSLENLYNICKLRYLNFCHYTAKSFDMALYLDEIFRLHQFGYWFWIMTNSSDCFDKLLMLILAPGRRLSRLPFQDVVYILLLRIKVLFMAVTKMSSKFICLEFADSKILSYSRQTSIWETNSS